MTLSNTGMASDQECEFLSGQNQDLNPIKHLWKDLLVTTSPPLKIILQDFGREALYLLPHSQMNLCIPFVSSMKEVSIGLQNY
jgi:hypothetical protein